MKKLVIITYADFPNGEAASVRIFSLCKMLLSKEFDISIISMSRQAPFYWNGYEGIKYISIRSPKTSIIARICNVVFFRRRASKVIRAIGDINYLMPLSLPITAMLYCERYAKKHKISLITDRTEWYSPCEFKLGRLSYEYLNNLLINRVIIDRYWKVISISRFFEKYFLSKGIDTIRIPAVMVRSDISVSQTFNYEQSRPLIVVYAGSPAKKDSLDKIVDAFHVYRGKEIELHVYGVTLEHFKKVNKRDDEYNNVSFHGRIPREKILSVLANSDFTVLFRDPTKRFTKAGFPSKVAESMMCGVPVITNLTSDLDLFLIDMKNAVVIPDYTVDSLVDVLQKVASLKKDQIKAMHDEAYNTAINSFDYSVYEEKFQSFFR